MKTNNMLTITWKGSLQFNSSVREIVTTKKFYAEVENISQEEPTKKVRIIVGESRPTVKKKIEVEKRVETFKNIKTIEKAKAILAKRNMDSIQSVTYNGEVIFEAKKEEITA